MGNDGASGACVQPRERRLLSGIKSYAPLRFLGRRVFRGGLDLGLLGFRFFSDTAPILSCMACNFET
jgi:hypothetical protein